jgi:hypothetical protein
MMMVPDLSLGMIHWIVASHPLHINNIRASYE